MSTRDYDNIWDYYWVDKIPTQNIAPLLPSIIDAIDGNIGDTKLRFTWKLIRNHLSACQFYIGTSEILIRPLLPPSNTHKPFLNANQRVYMSATLGEGGELERLTGRKDIKRINIKEGWDKQGIGRRLFFLPGRSLTENQSSDLVLDMIQITSRALVIVPDNRRADSVHELVSENLGYPTFSATQIEQSKQPFISCDQAVAIVANRYDGIDFLEDECRLLIIGGLPRATNLQERFIISNIGAVALLNDRILTRIQQAFGRCTRSATDYAAIVIWDEELHNYLMAQDRREFLHPELQAEIEFGIEQSKDVEANNFKENLQIFLTHGVEWEEVDNYIASLRDSLQRKNLPGTIDLQTSVQSELDYQYAIWDGNYIGALESCRKVLAELNDPDLRGYRALWNYLAGSALWLSCNASMSTNFAQIKDYYEIAQKAAPTINWLIRLSKASRPSSATSDIDNDNILSLIERVEIVLDNLGTIHDQNYNKEEKEILDKINDNSSNQFEEGHKRLGVLLGYEAGNVETPGAPDPWWIINDQLCFIFEDHSEADPESSLNINKARQVATHPNWAKENLPLSDSATIIPILVTQVNKIDEEALPHLQDVIIWKIDDFRNWAKRSLSVIREIRNTFPSPGDLMWRADAIEKYRLNNMDPLAIIKRLSKH